MTETAVLLLVALCSGYLYCVVSIPSRRVSAREVGHRLYFRAAFYACFTVSVSVLFYVLASLKDTASATPCVVQLWAWAYADTSPLPIRASLWELTPELIASDAGISIVFGSLPLALILAWIVNAPLFLSKELDLQLLKLVVRNRDFERLVLRSLNSSAPMLITLENRKIYIGWAVRAPDPTESREYLRILPLVSGFRGEEDHHLNFTTFYDDVLEKIGHWNEEEQEGEQEGDQEGDQDMQLNHLEAEDFEVVIPVNKIVSAHLFDLVAYNEFSGVRSNETEREAS